MLRALNRMEVSGVVEGWVLPPVNGYRAPEASDLETDCPAYGRLELTGGPSGETSVGAPICIDCEILEPR